MARPFGLTQRSSTSFILITVGVLLFSDLFLFSLVVPILPYILEHQANVPSSHAQSYVSLMLTAFSAASVVFHPFAAWATQKIHPRKIVYIAGVVLLALATALLFFARTVPLLVLSRMLQGASGSICWVVGMTLACETVGSQNLGKVIGSLYGVIILGTSFAPTIGGVVYQYAGMLWVIIIALGIILVDLILRLLVIEKKDAAKYEKGKSTSRTEDGPGTDASTDIHEDTALLENEAGDEYRLEPPKLFLFTKAPILCCLRSPSLLVSLAVIFVEAVFLSGFNATVPLHTQSMFKFNSFQSGLIMLAVGGPICIFGFPAGWAVDRFGTKYMTVIGFVLSGIGLVLLRLPKAGHDGHQVALYAVFLSIAATGVTMLDTTGIVESIIVVKRFHQLNPTLFGEHGPYIQHNALIGTVFSLGMAAGPEIAGGLTTGHGYASMSLIFGIVAWAMAFVSFVFLGGKPRVLFVNREA